MASGHPSLVLVFCPCPYLCRCLVGLVRRRRLGDGAFRRLRSAGELPRIGAVATLKHRRLVVIGIAEAGSLPDILQLVHAVCVDLLFERAPEVGDVRAEAEQGLLQMRDMGIEAGHPLSRILDGVAVLQIPERARWRRRRERADAVTVIPSLRIVRASSTISAVASPTIASGRRSSKPEYPMRLRRQIERHPRAGARGCHCKTAVNDA